MKFGHQGVRSLCCTFMWKLHSCYRILNKKVKIVIVITKMYKTKVMVMEKKHNVSKVLKSSFNWKGTFVLQNIEIVVPDFNIIIVSCMSGPRSRVNIEVL